MAYSTDNIKNIRTVKALRGDALTIDLGKVFSGTLVAWMKRGPNSTSFRTFDVVDGRYLVLSQDKTKDYLDQFGNVIEDVEGKWYFDVEQTLDPQKPEESKTIFKGTILFREDITNSGGIELSNPITSIQQYVESFLAIEGQTQYTVSQNKILDNGKAEVTVNGIVWNSRTGITGFPGGNISIFFDTGVIIFHYPLSANDQVIIKYN